MDLATMGLSDRANDRQPKPGATSLAAATRIDTMEALEDPLALLGRDSGPVVDHCQADAAALRAFHFEAYQPRPFAGVVDRVASEIAQCLCQSIGVGPRHSARHVAELEAPIGGQAETVPQLRYERPQLDLLR